MNRLQLSSALLSSLSMMILPSASARAEVTWTADLGTTGVGIHAGIPLASQYGLSARVGINYLGGYKFKKNTRQVAYDLKASLRTIDALLDWHPAQNGFRLTSGLIYNNNVVDGIGVPSRSTTFAFENSTYSTNQVGRLVGQIDFRTIAPYFGVGWQSPDNGRGWSVSSDLGVMYQGSPRTTLAFSGCTLPGAGCRFLADALGPPLAAESRRLNDELREYRYFPVLRVGLSYRF